MNQAEHAINRNAEAAGPSGPPQTLTQINASAATPPRS